MTGTPDRLSAAAIESDNLRGEIRRQREELENARALIRIEVSRADALQEKLTKAEAALTTIRDCYDDVDMGHEDYRVMACSEADKVLGGQYEATALEAVAALTSFKPEQKA